MFFRDIQTVQKLQSPFCQNLYKALEKFVLFCSLAERPDSVGIPINERLLP